MYTNVTMYTQMYTNVATHTHMYTNVAIARAHMQIHPDTFTHTFTHNTQHHIYWLWVMYVYFVLMKNNNQKNLWVNMQEFDMGSLKMILRSLYIS